MDHWGHYGAERLVNVRRDHGGDSDFKRTCSSGESSSNFPFSQNFSSFPQKLARRMEQVAGFEERQDWSWDESRLGLVDPAFE